MTEPNQNAAINTTPSSATPQVPTTPVAARRDKFASMAAAHRQKQTPSPAAAAASPGAPSTAVAAPVSAPFPPAAATAAPVSAPTNPASIPASAQQSVTASAPSVAASVPTANPVAPTTAHTPTPAPATQTAVPPRRGKFALLAGGGEGGKGKRFSNTSSMSSQTTQQKKNEIEKKRDDLKVRMSQRDSVLKDLEQAENLTWKLLTLAASTTRALSTLGGNTKPTITTSSTNESTKGSTTPKSVNISEIGKEYRETIHQIHSLLAPRASLVVPYQNHRTDKGEGQQQPQGTEKAETVTTKSNKTAKAKEEDKSNNNMYAARVEMRLALEKQKVLSALLRLEQEDNKQNSKDHSSTDIMMETTGTAIDNDTSRKRARED